MPFGSLSNVLEIKNAEGFRGSSVLQQSYPLTGYRTGTAVAAFTPLSLFAAGEQGVWYDPSDLTTMFEDSAGTTAVHTPGNGTADSPVGKILDKSGRGNHATQTTSTARPTLSAKYNLLTYTEQFDNAIWSKNSLSVTANATTAPDGTNTADKLVESVGVNYHYLKQQIASSTASAITSFTIYLKAAERSNAYISISNGGLSAYVSVNFDISTGTAGSLVFYGSGWTNCSVTSSSVGNGWYKVILSGQYSSSDPLVCHVEIDLGTTRNYNGDGTSGIYAWGADLRVSNDGVGLPAYQRVVDANTYDSTGFPYYLLGDGVNWKMVTGNINMTVTNKVTAFMGLRRLTDAVDITTAYEFNYVDNSASGSFVLFARNQYASSAYDFASRGSSTAEAYAPIASYPVPITNIVTGISDISAPVATLRVNGSQIATSTSSQGTGNYANAPLTLFSRPASPYRMFNGRNYGLIIRGASSTATEISNTETWLNGKTKAY